MSDTPRSSFNAYGIAVLSVLAAFTVMTALNPLLKMQQSPFLLFYTPIVLSAWYGGLKSGVLAIVLSTVLSNYFFLGAPYSLSLHLADLIRTGLFAAQGIVMCLLCEMLSMARRQDEATARQLRASEERFRAIFDQAAVGIGQVTIDGRFIEVNPALCEITGYSDEESHQLSIQAITYPDDLEIDRAYVRQILSGDINGYSLEKRYIRKDGILTWVNVTSSVIRDMETGELESAIGIVEDINDRKKTQTVQRLLIEISTVLASSLNYEENLTKLSRLVIPKLADVCIIDILQTDRTLKQLAIHCADPEKQAQFQDMHRRYPQLARQPHPFLQKLNQGKSIFYIQFPQSSLARLAHDEQHLQMLQQLDLRSLIVVPLLFRGKSFGTISLAMSESDRRYDYGDLILAEDIARRAAIAIDNAQLYQEAEQANRTKDEFLAILSHELRTPLNPIMGWAKLLRSKTYDQATQQRALETIERNAKLQVQLVEDLLDVSRILRGKLSLTVMPVNMVTVIESALETVRLMAEAKSIDLKLIILDSQGAGSAEQPDRSEAQAPRFMVSGDAARLQQVIWNLLSNAIKFTPEGGQVQVELSQVSQPLAAGYVQIRVIDTGKGITAEFLPHVFEYFRQADGSTTRRFGGLGLGLAIVRHLMDLHQGTVDVESAGEKQGATFTIHLPLLQTVVSAQAEQANRLLATDCLAGVRILAIDDEPDTRDFLEFLLVQNGANVSTAASASDAIQLLPKLQPNILICDIGMPDMDGYALMRHIRQSSTYQLPAIALTAYVAEDDRQQAIAAGFQRHIAKPIESDELIATIIQLVQYTDLQNRSPASPAEGQTICSSNSY